jgi:hypothetical protein
LLRPAAVVVAVVCCCRRFCLVVGAAAAFVVVFVLIIIIVRFVLASVFLTLFMSKSVSHGLILQVGLIAARRTGRLRGGLGGVKED